MRRRGPAPRASASRIKNKAGSRLHRRRRIRRLAPLPTLDSVNRIYGGRGAAWLGRGAGGQGAALLVARRRLAARHSRLPMPTLCAGALACGGLHLADAGSARQGGHGSRWVLLSSATAAAAAVATGQGRSAPGPPAPCLSLIGRPSESSPCQHSRPPRPAWLRADPLSRSLEKLSGKRTLS